MNQQPSSSSLRIASDQASERTALRFRRLGERTANAVQIRGRAYLHRMERASWAIRRFSTWRDLLIELNRTEPTSGIVNLQTRDGLTIAIRRNVWDARIVREIFQSKPYLRHFSLPEIPVIVDIGSYIGDFALYAAHYLNARVVAYEPTAENLAILHMNVAANSLENQIEVVNKAVGDGTPVTLHVAKNGEEIHVSRYWYEQGEDRVVETVCVADLFPEHQLETIDLLKVDCEGCEYDIFDALAATDFARIRNIVFEYHRFDGSAERLDRLQALLTERGYHLIIDGPIISATRH